MRTSVSACVLACVASLPVALHAQPLFRLDPLSPPGDFTLGSSAFGRHAEFATEVAFASGAGSATPDSRIARRTVAGSWDLIAPPQGFSTAHPAAIHAGILVGHAVPAAPGSGSDGNAAAFIHRNNAYTLLSPLGGFSNAYATLANARGDAVGLSQRSPGNGNGPWQSRITLWQAGAASPTAVGPVVTGGDAFPIAISEGGSVLGATVRSSGPGPRTSYWLWQGEQTLSVEAPAGTHWAGAMTLGTDGSVLGNAIDADGAIRRLAWTPGAGATVVADLTPAAAGLAALTPDLRGIGTASDSDERHDTLSFYYADGRRWMANELRLTHAGWQIHALEAIADDGVILALGVSPTGEAMRVLLTPAVIPAPGATVAALGAAGILAARRRRR